MYYITAHFCICAKVYDNITVAVNTLIIAKCSYFKFNNLYITYNVPTATFFK